MQMKSLLHHYTLNLKHVVKHYNIFSVLTQISLFVLNLLNIFENLQHALSVFVFYQFDVFQLSCDDQ